MLSSFGALHVDMAVSAEDALEKCRFNFYDIVLCDFNLGEGKNGQQVLEALRANKRLKHTHLFIMVTAETAKDVVLGTREYQPDAYIAKPITRTVLEQRLGQLITQQHILQPINREIDLENYAKAISICLKLLEEKSKYQSWCYQTLGQLYLKVGDTDNAISIYQSILSKRELPWAVLGIGLAYLAATKYDKASVQLKRAIELNPNLLEAYDALAECHLKAGQLQDAQQVLSSATQLSPRLIARHEKLGEVCQQNQDILSAADAFKQAIKYGQHSIYDQPSNYLNLGRCLSDWSEGNTSPEGVKCAQEAIEVLDNLTRKFPAEEEACLNATLIEARVHSGQDQTQEAADKLHQAECMIEEENLNAEVGLELAKTLYSLKQTQRAEATLIKLAEKYSGDPAILARIESLMDEPEGLAVRREAKELNTSGIHKFDLGDLQGAISDFDSALALTPKHAALNLNLIQVVLKAYRIKKEKDLLRRAEEALARIQHIPEQHNQFKRLQHLKAQVDKLKHKDN